jgi:hypothetical protein
MKHSIAILLAAACAYALTPTAFAAGNAAELRLQAEEAPPKQDKPKRKRPTDAQIRQILIDESIAAYSGNCPCPYSTMSNGRKCGRRSAYSRPGGEAPLCYAKDVTAEMVQAYREANPEE